MSGVVVRVGTQSFELGPGGAALIGRGADAAVHVDNVLVSRHHGRVVDVGGAWRYEDLGSRHGTFRNGVRVSEVDLVGHVVLHLGDAVAGPAVAFAPAAAPAVAFAPAGTGALPPPPAPLAPRFPVRVGRTGDNDVVLDDLLVSRHHAEVREVDGGARLVDLGSHNGTFLNGRLVRDAPLADGDLVAVGGARLRWAAGRLERLAEARGSGLAARNLTVWAPGGSVLLDDVSLHVPDRSLVAIVGPSGSGKSTLVDALSGLRPAARGDVWLRGRDLYAERQALRRQIGWVPQDDLVHPDLTVGDSLRFAARLRFPPDVAPAELDRRVDEVIDELGLGERRHVRVRDLSGGQRKRVSVALELLTRPGLLFLDEPTSGLDPAFERSVMQSLRALADGGRIVVVITHSVDSLHLCDHVVFLAPGGRVAFFGPPALAPGWFGCNDIAEAFALVAGGDPRARRDAYAAGDLHRRLVAEPLAALPPPGAGTAPAGTRGGPDAGRPGRRLGGWVRQARALSARYVKVLAADRRTVAILLAAAPALGLVLALRLPTGSLGVPSRGGLRLLPGGSIVVFALVMGVMQLGAASAIREVVKERAIYRRERAVGLSLSAYLASKVVVLGGLAVAQAAIVVLIATARQGGPGPGVVLPWGRVELICVCALACWAGMAAALALSAIVANADQAAIVLPAFMGFQVFAASAKVLPAAPELPVLDQLGYLAPSQWAFNAAAGTVDLNELQSLGALGQEVATLQLDDLRDPVALLGRLPDHSGQAVFNHSADRWWGNIAVLGVLIVASLVGAGLALRRDDPR